MYYWSIRVQEWIFCGNGGEYLDNMGGAYLMLVAI